MGCLLMRAAVAAESDLHQSLRSLEAAAPTPSGQLLISISWQKLDGPPKSTPPHLASVHHVCPIASGLWPLSFRHALGCNPIGTAGAGFWRPVRARRLFQAATGAQCLPRIAERKYGVIPYYPVGVLQIPPAKVLIARFPA
jgi:hypothetical protein